MDTVMQKSDRKTLGILVLAAGLLGLALASPFSWGEPGALATGEAGKPVPVSPEAVQFFETKVRPILADHCFRCHAKEKQKGNLRVDSLAALLEGGGRGPALVPGHPEKSLLIKAIQHDSAKLKMPPTKKLNKEQIAYLTQWVKLGAPWSGAQKTGGSSRKGEMQVTDKDREHWAFQPLKRPKVPAVKNKEWGANPIDAFILARLEAKGLSPNPPASKTELIRRIYFDLIGLPPAPEEVQAFLADTSSNAYEKLVDQLLNSPGYGEKWGRHWLDLVRYAETNSYERDNPKPHVWRYRDYVIRAFNADKPYDQFIREQLAGDELIEPAVHASGSAADALIATGYYRLGIWDDEPSDPLQARYDGLDDIVATTGQLFLGLTFDCARCHDHKIDPVPQKDYYRLLAFFHNINHYRNGGPTDEVPLLATAEARQAYDKQAARLEKKRQDIRTSLKAIEQEFQTRYQKGKDDTEKPNSGNLAGLIDTEGLRVLGKERFETYRKLKKDLSALKKAKVATDMALCVTEAGRQAPETFVLVRGNPHVRGAKVEPAFPEVLTTLKPVFPSMPASAKTSGRRLVLANWIASKDNPLTARVMVNRIWQYHFGRGIVRTPNDFGLQGTRPTHPELLDWLATELLAQGWRMKSLHRLIVTSQVYRMSSRGNPKALAADPANDLFWRFDMRRLSAEEVRDSILAVTASLNLKMYGPGIFPEIPKEVLAGQSMPGRGWGKSPPQEQNRRSVYIHVKRSLLMPILEIFDLAEPDRSTPVRFTTTQPTQALAMLNGDFLNKQAAIFTQRLGREAGKDVEKQVRRALYLATSRQPGAQEVQRGLDLIEALQKEDGATAEQALNCFCLMVLNLNEFIYLD
jgi:hypothetical protein